MSGSIAVMLAREPGAGAAESGDHLVDDQQNVVSVADLAHPPEIASVADLHAVGLHDRLGDERRDVVRPFVLDLPLQIVGAEIEVRLFVHAKRIAVVTRSGDEGVAGNARLGDVAGAEPVGRAERAHGRAVVGVPARDDLVGPRLPACAWYCLAILMAASTASEPPLTKMTFDRPSGASSAILAGKLDRRRRQIAGRADVMEAARAAFRPRAAISTCRIRASSPACASSSCPGIPGRRCP